MIKIKSFNYIVLALLFALYTLICTACENPIMAKWWPEEKDITPPVYVPEKSGVNFAVVYLDLNGGITQSPPTAKSALEPFRVLYNTKVPRVRPITHTNTDLGFGGWIDENGNLWDMNTRLVKPEDDVNSDGIITLTAKWVLDTVTVTFVTNYVQFQSDPNKYPKRLDGTGAVITVPTQNIIRGGKAVEPPVIPTGTPEGLIGWFTAQNYNSGTGYADWDKQWDFANDSVTANTTLYARWGTSSRSVHLQVNGGKRPDTNSDGTGGTELTRVNFTVYTGPLGKTGGRIIDPGPLVRAGYTFAGWYTDSGVLWDFATSRVKESDIWGGDDNNILLNDYFILHARWVPNIYYVTFDPNGGTPAPAWQEVMHGERVTMPQAMTNSDTTKAFKEWISDAGTAWKFDTDVVTRSMTLTAVWEPMTYTVTFHLGSPPAKTPTVAGLHNVYKAAQPAAQRVKANGKIIEPFMPALPANAASTNWSFVRWDSALSYSGNPDTIDRTSANTNGLTEWNFETGTVTGNMTLYARWVEAAPDMIWVPPGSFTMGDSGVSGSPAEYHAYPTRRVTLDGFYISRYEVTQLGRQDTNPSYTDIMGINPSQFYKNDVRPVDRVSWYDAIEYCNRLTALKMTTGDQVYTINSPVRATGTNFLAGTNSRVNNVHPTLGALLSAPTTNGAFPLTSATVTWQNNKNGYRLPTEAEWEYAARGGHNSPGNFIYSGSNDASAVAWHTTNIALQEAGSTQTVGTRQSNALGIYDMSGNISEWVWDKFESYKHNYYTTGTDSLHNPKGPSGSNGNAGPANGDEQRVRRGGQWNNAASNVRSVVRNSEAAKTANWVIGFRVVRGPSAIW